MGIVVVESFVEGKDQRRVCEDVIVTSDDFAAVIDGASDETGVQYAGKTGGRFAADAIAMAIEHLSPVSTPATSQTSCPPPSRPL